MGKPVDKLRDRRLVLDSALASGDDVDVDINVKPAGMTDPAIFVDLMNERLVGRPDG